MLKSVRAEQTNDVLPCVQGWTAFSGPAQIKTCPALHTSTRQYIFYRIASAGPYSGIITLVRLINSFTDICSKLN